ncbi:hypothetical protein ACFSLT_20700 [Novosphingobium resinovorum]
MTCHLKSSWGVNWTAPEEADVFYTGEVLRARSHARWGGYIETTVLAGFKTTFTAKAINGQDSSRWRRFYSPSRAGAYTGSEERNQKQGVIVSMAVVRAF